MTFFQRKNTLVVEMYEAGFYSQKPTMDKIVDFIYKDLCPLDELRKAVEDIQFHPVKMFLFVKFSGEAWRDGQDSVFCWGQMECIWNKSERI